VEVEVEVEVEVTDGAQWALVSSMDNGGYCLNEY